MHTFKFFVSVCAVLVLSFTTNNEVTAAPHPCLWMLDYEHTHPDTTVPPTTAKPELVEQFANLGNKKNNQLEKLITDWLLWGPSSESQRSSNPLEKMIASYMKFLDKIFKNILF